MDRDHALPSGAPVPNRGKAKTIRGLLDAKAQHKKHPETFEVPTTAQLKKIKPGDHVKVSRKGERFWVLVTGFEKRRIHGTVDNKLIRNDDLPLGTTIYFQKKNILSYLPKKRRSR